MIFTAPLNHSIPNIIIQIINTFALFQTKMLHI